VEELGKVRDAERGHGDAVGVVGGEVHGALLVAVASGGEEQDALARGLLDGARLGEGVSDAEAEVEEVAAVEGGVLDGFGEVVVVVGRDGEDAVADELGGGGEPWPVGAARADDARDEGAVSFVPEGVLRALDVGEVGVRADARV
jgi:hypothetical protein